MMKIESIKVCNFRLLKNVELMFEDTTTVIVGRNNSGKTSLTEVFRRLFTDDYPRFYLEDFSLSAHEKFWTAFQLFVQESEDDAVRQELPFIEVVAIISYDITANNLGALGNFIIDLNTESNKAKIRVRYELGYGKIGQFFNGIVDEFEDGQNDEEKKKLFFKIIKERLPKNFYSNLFAIDPSDETNQKEVEANKLKSLFQVSFINAQRGLDDETSRNKIDKNVLGRILESLFATASSENALPHDKQIAQSLDATLKDIQRSIDEDFNGHLSRLLPTLNSFGYPGLNDPGLHAETILNAKSLMSNYTRMRYAGINGISLPENYNGLGTRNLIYILLKLLEAFKIFQAKQQLVGVHLIFIEEPEAHLHPQMQEVFMRQISEVAGHFVNTYNEGNPWPVQFVVSTHSSHMANSSSFASIRYFLSKEMLGHKETLIKDLRRGFSNNLTHEDKTFLHQYLTLTSCDLFFADKAILIEGVSERIMLPRIIQKIDSEEGNTTKMGGQYYSVLEVGGAYAHKFFGLLNFLELKSIIITDIDAVALNTSSRRWKACPVSMTDSRTSNECLKKWFNDDEITVQALLSKTVAEKTNGLIRLCYQVSESNGGSCGRSFEAAFMLANRALFDLTSAVEGEIEQDVWDRTADIKKSEFALKYGVDIHNWQPPKYISDGIKWLSQSSQPLLVDLLL